LGYRKAKFLTRRNITPFSYSKTANRKTYKELKFLLTYKQKVDPALTRRDTN